MKSQWTISSQRLETDVRRRQAGQLKKYLRTVVLPFSAHYRNLFHEHGLSADSIRTLEDLSLVPFTTKTDLLNPSGNSEHFRDFVLLPEEAILSHRPGVALQALIQGRASVRDMFEKEFRPVFMTFTTGRSAEPIPFLYTRHDLDRLAIAGRRVMEICGARHEDKMLNLFPYAPHLAFWQTHYAGATFGAMMFSSGGGKVMSTDDTLRLIRKLRPNVLIGIPTFIYHVLHQAAEEGLRWENLRCIVLGGEKVSDGLRQKLKDLASELGVGGHGLDVLATYGFTEAKMAWTECPVAHGGPPAGYHLCPNFGIIEIIDPKTGKTVPDGQPGEIVFTSLDARGTAVLRYRTGDFTDGGLSMEPCPYCGRAMPRLTGHISRSAEIREMNLDKLKGTLVDFNELEHVLDDAPHVGAWQIELRKANDDPLDLDEIVLHVQKTNGADEGQLRRDLSDRCHRFTDIHPNQIVFHDTEEIRQLQGVGTLIKEQKLVDHRPKVGAETTATRSS